MPVPDSYNSMGIKLKGGVMLATKFDLAEISAHDSLSYALICRHFIYT
jgi:hypothetical protein